MKTNEYYNKIYNESSEYKKHYSDIIYFPIFKEIIKKICKHNIIIELGCGAGQLAHYLMDNKYCNYLGIDFSNKAIEQAIKTVGNKFIVKDLLSYNIDLNYDTIIALEFFEHIEYKKVLTNLKSDTKIIFSVPNFKIDSHLYYWKDEAQIKRDFSKYIDIVTIENPLSIKNKKWFLVNGIIK